MQKTKYGKYIVYNSIIPPSEGAPPPPPPSGERTGASVLYVDNTILKGAFYFSCALIWKASDRGSPPTAHCHYDYDEYIGFAGSNPKNPQDLCGEVEVWLDDEKHVINKSCAIFVPKGLQHCPVYFRRVERPIFYFSTAPSISYGKDQPAK
ncbi:MAG: hypothetical protein JXA17_05215 [Dehalococcoidales bacterium]|nr:hypothetical protein [Dehalococcoidales bacterium]